MTKAQKRLFDMFKELDIETTLYMHEPLYIVEQAQAIAHVVPGVWCKNLFLKDDKKRVWLL